MSVLSAEVRSRPRGQAPQCRRRRAESFEDLVADVIAVDRSRCDPVPQPLDPVLDGNEPGSLRGDMAQVKSPAATLSVLVVCVGPGPAYGNRVSFGLVLPDGLVRALAQVRA